MQLCLSRPFWGHNLAFKKKSHFSTGIKRAKFTKSSSLWKINFCARWKKLSFSTRWFKKGNFNIYNNFYIGCNSDAFERLSIVQRCRKLIGSEISFLTLYAMRFGRIYCINYFFRNIISLTGRQIKEPPDLRWNGGSILKILNCKGCVYIV